MRSRINLKNLSAQHIAELAQFLEAEGVGVSHTTTIPRREPTDTIPLSFAQERLWFLDRFMPDNPAYNISVALRLRGSLDLSALQQSLTAIVERHAALRTVFAAGNEPIQVIAPAAPVGLAIVDLSQLPEAELEPAARRRASDELLKPFDLAQGPLFRFHLLRLDPDEHILLLTIHHIIFDGWSVGIFHQELTTHYNAYRQGTAPTLPDLPIQFADYAHWQREQSRDEQQQEHLAYWKRHLQPEGQQAPALLELPTDRPRPPVQTYRAGTLPIVLPRETIARLTALGQAESATRFMTLLAAFKILIARYTGRDDIVVGTPIAGRTQAETQPLIGFFANTLALRTNLEGNLSFRQLLGRVRETTLGAFAHQDTPFEQIVEALRLERNLSYTPIFQIVFMLQNTPGGALKLDGLEAEPFLTDTPLAKFDLQLGLWEVGGELQGELLYNADLYDATTIERVAAHYAQLLESIAAQPDQPIMLLPMLTAAERRQLLHGPTDRPSTPAHDLPLHVVFEAQAARTPDAIALSGEQGQMTYAELNRRANRLAHRLRAMGVGPDQLVGLGMQRSLDLIVGLLGILKAGGAYLPIDPSYPPERIGFMLSDAAAPVVVTHEQHRALFAEQVAQIIALDADWPDHTPGDESNLPNITAADHLAYVIYTSGSTGRPKGVLVPHRQVTRLFTATDHWFDFGERDVWTFFHSSAFDFSVWEIWGALLYGGRLVVVPYMVSRSPEAFYDLLHTERVTVLNQTPSAFRQLMHVALHRSEPQPSALRYVIFGGEALELQSLQPWFDRFGDQQPELINMYGITETTVHVTYRPIRAADIGTTPGSMIGQPIPDLRVYVLDRYQQLAPMGVPGEMYVGGAGVARGYLNRPELTTTRFIPDPFSQPGARLYRTGDLARSLPNGDLQYLGRIDHQVKIRGFRIELGEIESALAQHPQIREVVVMPHGDRLVAYIVENREQRTENKEHGDGLTTDLLRQFLHARLPEYMIPAMFMFLESLPLTPTGKLDRRALPAPDTTRPELAETYVAPQTTTEAMLAQIWAEALQLSQVGIHDNFFALGGDSMRSVQVLGLARARGMHFSLQQLFQHQTIAELAQHVHLNGAITTGPAHAAPFSMITDEDRRKLPDGIEDAYPLTMLQAGMLYHMALMPDAPDYHNVDSFYYRAPFDLDTFRAAVQHVVARHPILRTAFDLSSYSEPLQLVHTTAVFDITFEDIRHLSTAEQEAAIRAYVRQETTRLFDFSQPPLLRYRIHLRTDDSFQFTLTECHAILDGWSLSTVSAEVFAAYFALLDHGVIAEQPPLTSAFRDFVLQERTALQSEPHRQFWLGNVADAPFLKLPRWSTAPQDDQRQVRRRTVTIMPDLLAGLQRLVSTLGVPFKTVLLAAHLRVMSLVSGQTDILTGYTTHGRLEENDGERVCGLFLNVLPLRQQLVGGTWAELIRAAFETEYQVLTYRHYPMAAIQQQLGRGQLFEVVFNYTHFRPIAQLEQNNRLEQLDFTITSEPANHGLVASFYLDPVNDELRLFLQYHTTTLADEQVDALSGYYTTVLALMAQDHLARHDLANLLTDYETQALLNAASPAAASYPAAQCSHELVAAWAERTPDTTAIVYADLQGTTQRLTYRELNQRANQLAHHLQARGVQPGVCVGLCARRSPELIVGLLAILKAGGAYLPLDPAYPAERLQFMLQETGAPVLLTQQALVETLPPHNAAVVLLDADRSAIDQQRTTAPISGVTPDDLAYIIFTSGSTGTPKGTLLAHRGLCNLAAAQIQAFGVTSESRVLQFASPSFDASVAEIFVTLSAGATLVLHPGGTRQEALMPGPNLLELLRDQAITTVTLPPSALAVLPPQDLPALHTLIVAGEECPLPLAQRWRVRPDGTTRRFINAYGPTETTVCATVFEWQHDEQPLHKLPVGRPIANTQVYILDERLQLAPIGTPGEIYIGGIGLAWGYLNRPDLTALRFVPDPFAQTPGSRLYRSGDAACYRPDGTIEFLGRRDRQVKVRGFRVEPGEIEAALMQHSSVREAVAVVREDTPGDRRLVAYVVEQRNKVPARAGEQRTNESDSDDGSLSSASGYPVLGSEALRAFLRDRLPDYLVPSHIVLLDALPLTPNGKIDRNALPAPTPAAPTATFVAPQTAIEQMIADVWREVLRVDHVGIYETFFDLGGHSLLLVQAHSKLRALLGRDLKMLDLFTYPTIHALASYLTESLPETALQISERAKPITYAETSIAIVGMAGRFPGAPNVAAFWEKLRDGVELIGVFSEDEVIAAGVDPVIVRDPAYVKAGGVLDGIEQFDAAFFGMSPREAELMDPQQRFFLECAWEALEHAGYDAEQFPGLIGVYGGSSISMYLLNNLYPQRDAIPVLGNFQATTGNDKDHLATRTSYKLNLKGPSVTVQTACSTSLVAIHLACQSLLLGECDLALAGGVSIRLLQKTGYHYQEGGVVSPDGHCRAFDANAAGTVDGDGVGVVVLKRLDAALKDGDTIYAMIRGSAINNDGAHKLGYAAPSSAGQAEVIAAAQAVADVAPETISYVEAHGTGTNLGDPIEVAALNLVFGANGQSSGSCALGSVKTNIGHLDAAAGVAGLIKTALALKHQVLPPSLHFEQANPQIDFANSPFYVNTKLTEWPIGPTPRRAGVSSFGIGGTNAHVVLEEPPVREPSGPGRPWQLLVLSAKTQSALATARQDLATYLKQQPSIPLADIAYTLQVGRRSFAQRLAVVCQDHADAIRVLESGDATRFATATVTERKPSLVFLFPGQGAQYVGMAAELYQSEPLFHAAIDQCAELLTPHLGLDLRAILYPETEQSESETQQLTQTWLAQPALFVIEYALAQLLMSWGIQPHAMIGHSIGEYVAATISGVFSLEDALALVALRGRLMQQCPTGAMLSVPLPVPEVTALLGESLSLAAVNGPELCVVAGAEAAIEQIAALLAEQGIETQRLHTSHAFHSALMEPIVETFAAALQAVRLNPPQRPYLSNLTGSWITAAEATDPRYWARHLRETVKFGAGIATVTTQPDQIFVEVGPGRALTTLVRRQIAPGAGHTTLATMRHPRDHQADLAMLLTALGQLWLAGVTIDWQAVYRYEQRQRVPLPTYPFERQRYWIDAKTPAAAPSMLPRTDKQPSLDDWFYAPMWQQSAPPTSIPEQEPGSCWLIFLDQNGLGATLAQRLRQAGQAVVTVTTGTQFDRLDDDQFAIQPQARRDYDRLLQELRASDRSPQTIVHLGTLTAAQPAPTNDDTALNHDFQSLLALVQALADRPVDLHLSLITNGLNRVTGEESLDPTKALLLGPTDILGYEYPTITTGSIDIVVPEPGSWQEELLIEQLIGEVAARTQGTIAYRRGARWLRSFEPVRLAATPQQPKRLREGGVYLITGGLGGIGLELAAFLAQTVHAKLALVGRSALPEPESWDHWLATHPDSDPSSRKIQQIRSLESAGAEVLLLTADVADRAQIERAVQQTYARFGALHGVIHAAGVAGGGVIPLQTPEEIAAVLAPKVQGTLVLDQILGHLKLDLLVLCSSLRSIVGGAGQIAYYAANAFLDHYAHYAAAQRGPAVVAINWGTWSETGMSVAAAVEAGLDSTALAEGMTSQEGVEAFRRVLGGTFSQIAVSPQHLPALIAEERATARARLTETTGPTEQGSQHERPNLPYAYVAPTNQREQLIVKLWQEALGIQPIGIGDSFFDLGGDSIVGLQIAAKAKRVGLTITPKQIFEHPTIAELAVQIEATGGVQAEQDAISGPVPLTPIQHWFFEQPIEPKSHWNQALLLATPPALDAAALEQVLTLVVAHHDALRLRFHATDGVWQQQNLAAETAPYFSRVDIAALSPAEQKALIETTAAAQQTSLDLTHGPIVRAVFFDGGASSAGRLLLIAHHLAVDVISWGILLEDLETAYRQITRNEPATLPLKTTSFKRWAEQLTAYARSETLLPEYDYWQSHRSWSLAPLPRDLPTTAADNLVATGDRVSVAVDRETTAQLQELAASRHVQMHEILLAALALVCAEWTTQPRLAIELEGHGREDLFADADLSRTVGWFTSAYPAYLSLDSADPHQALLAVKAQLRAIPQRGIGYGLLRYLSPDPAVREQMEALPRPEINFLYLGQRDHKPTPDALFGPAAESSGPNLSPTARRTHVFEIGASIADGQIQIEWGYSTRLHHRATVQQLVQTYLSTLAALLDDQSAVPQYAPSDFPFADLSQQDLDNLVVELDDFLGDTAL